MTDQETPTAPDASDVKAIIEAAVGLTWDNFKARHPIQAAGIERSLGGKPIVPEIIEVLEADSEYEQLVIATTAEADVAAVIAAIAPLVINALATVLAG